MATRVLRRIYAVWLWVIAAAVVVQVFLAGLYVFGANSIVAHEINGSLLLFATLLPNCCLVRCSLTPCDYCRPRSL